MDTRRVHVGALNSKPDLFLLSKTAKRIVLVELNVSWETNIGKDQINTRN